MLCTSFTMSDLWRDILRRKGEQIEDLIDDLLSWKPNAIYHFLYEE